MLKINEIFYSIQGEGRNAGLPVVFVRLSGCNRACSWCDTKDHVYGIEMSDDTILRAIAEYPVNRVIFTGGEPAMHEGLMPIVRMLKSKGYWTAIETNGDFKIETEFNWITVSPKTLDLRQGHGDELKIVFTNGVDPAEFLVRYPFPAFHFYYLQPCSGRNIPETITYIKNHPQWRLSLQWQKLIFIK